MSLDPKCFFTLSSQIELLSPEFFFFGAGTKRRKKIENCLVEKLTPFFFFKLKKCFRKIILNSIKNYLLTRSFFYFLGLPMEYKKPATNSFIQKLNERKKENGDFVEVEKTILDGIKLFY